LISFTRSKYAAKKMSASSLSTPTFVQYQSTIATVQFIMPSPFYFKSRVVRSACLKDSGFDNLLPVFLKLII
ncbi:MAG: hypothetical protein ACR2MD_05420, partial [Aridibacter sp.]